MEFGSPNDQFTAEWAGLARQNRGSNDAGHSIRTTVTLDEDVLERVKQESRERGHSFRETLNNLLRFALSAEKTPVPEQKPFKIRPFHDMGVFPGLNYDKMSELLDYAEAKIESGNSGCKHPDLFTQSRSSSA
jgi:uncharacterized protein (DUF4415 family)